MVRNVSANKIIFLMEYNAFTNRTVGKIKSGTDYSAFALSPIKETKMVYVFWFALQVLRYIMGNVYHYAPQIIIWSMVNASLNAQLDITWLITNVS